MKPSEEIRENAKEIEKKNDPEFFNPNFITVHSMLEAILKYLDEHEKDHTS